MEYNFLGRTELKVSRICLGTMTYGEQTGPADAFAQMDLAVASGVNFFDTAELYAIPPKAETYGRTEEIVGDWLKRSGKRKDVILATKVVGPAGQMTWIRNGTARLDRAQITDALDASLRRLKTDYIDLYQTHWPQRPVNNFGKLGYDQFQVSGREADVIQETVETMADFVRAGKVRHFGLSNETPWGVMQHLRITTEKSLPRVVSIQNPYNLLNRTFEFGLSEITLQEKVGLLAYSPLGAGVLTGKYLDGKVPKGSRWDIDHRGSRYKKPKMEEAVIAYTDIAARYGIDPAQMAIAFVNHRPFVTSTIIGATTTKQLKHILDGADLKLPEEALRDIDQVHALNPNPCP